MSKLIGAASCFNQRDVFPIIARIIKQIYEQRSFGFISHEEISEGLLSDDRGRHEIDLAKGRCPARSPEWLADNMVAWFSQKYTTGDSPYVRRFDREKMRGKWAYRPAQGK